LWGDIYFDDSVARVVIADSSSFNPFGNPSEVHYEMQELNSWEGSTISFTANQGSFTSQDNLSLFVIDENGIVSNGYPVSFDGVAPNCLTELDIDCKLGDGITDLPNMVSVTDEEEQYLKEKNSKSDVFKSSKKSVFQAMLKLLNNLFTY